MRGSSLSRGLRVDGLGGTLSADDGHATSFEAHPESLIFWDGMIARKAERFYWFKAHGACACALKVGAIGRGWGCESSH